MLARNIFVFVLQSTRSTCSSDFVLRIVQDVTQNGEVRELLLDGKRELGYLHMLAISWCKKGICERQSNVTFSSV